MEIWKPVVGFEEKYAVSSLGRVKNIVTGKLLKPYYNDHLRYEKVKLYKGEKAEIRKIKFIHRLVASAFLGDMSTHGMQVNHIDGNRRNNRLENLEWCTASENIKHAYRTGLFDEGKIQSAKKRSIPVEQLSMDGVLVKTWDSMSDASRGLGLDVSNISNCCKGIIKSTGGYKWRKTNSGHCTKMK